MNTMYEKKESKVAKTFRFIAALFLLSVVCTWTLKGLEYLSEKTRETRLNADYTEVMLRNYKD